ncbi:unnamed protein product [Sphagnum balticum]
MLVCAFVAFVRTWNTLNKYEKEETMQPAGQEYIGKEIYYAFIIRVIGKTPTCSQKLWSTWPSTAGLPADTSSSWRMEAHEENSEIKAEELIEQFRGRFKLMGYTLITSSETSSRRARPPTCRGVLKTCSPFSGAKRD